MLSAALSGFFLSFSLILAIGAQNAFVFRQGLLAKHVHLVVWFCAVSDAILICAGVFGLGHVLAPVMAEYEAAIFAAAALWLSWYGAVRLRSALMISDSLAVQNQDGKTRSALKILGAIALITWLNPHVYIDTVLLIGTLSLGFEGGDKISFAIGASIASASFFASLGYGAARLHRYMTHPRAWQLVDFGTAAIMFIFAAIMLFQAIPEQS